MARFLVLHGPNLNMLGQREKEHYGNTTLAQINQQLANAARSHQIQLDIFQSNAEHELIEQIQTTEADLIILNAGGYSHSSIAIRDALLARQHPMIEVHISNVAARESFRQTSLLSDIAIGTIQGFGAYSYLLALQAGQHYYLNHHCQQEEPVDGHS